jgi:hypothetical protein
MISKGKELRMFTLFIQHKNFMIGILALLSLSIICQIVIGVIYHRLIWETENMSATKNKALQQLKLKFSGRSQISEGMPNVSIFVDKFLNQLKIGTLPISFLKHLSGQLVMLAVLVAGIGACLSIINGEGFFDVAPFYVISFLGLYCYFAVSSLIDVPGKVKTLRTNLIDYLENHLANRLEQTKLDIQLVTANSKSVAISEDSDSKPVSPTAFSPCKSESAPTLSSGKKESSPAVSKSEAEELERLLKEFLA